MTTRNKQRMGGELTAKHLGASVKLLYAAAETDFYLRENELATIVIPEVDNK